MKAVISIEPGKPPCLIYWTGRVRLHVEVLTYCGEQLEADDGVLQIPDDVKVCDACDEACLAHKYPKQTR